MKMFLCGAVVALVLVALALFIFLKRENDGTIQVYPPTEEGEDPYLFLVLNEPVPKIQKKNWVLFNIKNMSDTRE